MSHRASGSELIKAQIATQIYRACQKLGAGPELLSIIGSYGDTLSDEDVLMLLERHNSGKPIFDEVVCTFGYDDLGTVRH